jgi:diapolycopene oxygenase
MISKQQYPPQAVGVIGAGLGGLAAAATLAARGHRVILFERNEWLGGKAAVLSERGFRFDMGPTILTLPSVLTRIFAEAGRNLSDYLHLVPLDPQWRSFFEDGSTLDLFANPDDMDAALSAYSPGTNAAEGYRKFLALAERQHSVSDRYFFWRSVGSVRDTFNGSTTFSASVLSDLLALRFGRTVSGTVRSHVKDPRVAQMLDHFTQYVGSAPDASPAVLCGIAHMQTSEGIWYPQGGIQAVPKALTRLIQELGVDIRTGTGIRQIYMEGGRARGVVTAAGERVPLSGIVSDADSVRTHGELLEAETKGRAFARLRHVPAW